jgi:ubiquinone/menaquinone biosynthesis C-methylase UbiE
MILGQDEVRALYRRTAPFYDATVWMYRLVGLAGERNRAIAALCLRPGDTVIDMGCGTGLNLPALSDAVGPTGRVIGVDLTDAMLQRARRRVERNGLANVELIEADLTKYRFPAGLKGALATFSLEMVPEYDAVLQRTSDALLPGGRLALFGLRHPERWPAWLTRVGVWLNRPFGVSSDYAAMTPWEAGRRHLREIEYRDRLAGAAYIWVGEAS